MKPNPVKKTVEYCKYDESNCVFYTNHYCKKHDKSLYELIHIIRPQWCTDETIVRVQIEPVVFDSKEYCFLNSASCDQLSLRWDEVGEQQEFRCAITKERGFCGGMQQERPEACRKLEVE